MAECFFNTPECNEMKKLTSHNIITIGEPTAFSSGRKYTFVHFDVYSSDKKIVLSVFLKYDTTFQDKFIGGEIIESIVLDEPQLEKFEFESIEDIGKYICIYFDI